MQTGHGWRLGGGGGGGREKSHFFVLPISLTPIPPVTISFTYFNVFQRHKVLKGTDTITDQYFQSWQSLNPGNSSVITDSNSSPPFCTAVSVNLLSVVLVEVYLHIYILSCCLTGHFFLLLLFCLRQRYHAYPTSAALLSLRTWWEDKRSSFLTLSTIHEVLEILKGAGLMLGGLECFLPLCILLSSCAKVWLVNALCRRGRGGWDGSDNAWVGRGITTATVLGTGQDRQVMHTQGPRWSRMNKDTRMPCSMPSPCAWQNKHNWRQKTNWTGSVLCLYTPVLPSVPEMMGLNDMGGGGGGGIFFWRCTSGGVYVPYSIYSHARWKLP